MPPQRFPGAATINTPGRGHLLLRSPLEGALVSVAASRTDRPVSGLWWPQDRAWFVVTEVDFEWTFVAGTDSLVDRLVHHPGLEAARTDPHHAAGLPEDPS